MTACIELGPLEPTAHGSTAIPTRSPEVETAGVHPVIEVGAPTIEVGCAPERWDEPFHTHATIAS